MPKYKVTFGNICRDYVKNNHFTAKYTLFKELVDENVINTNGMNRKDAFISTYQYKISTYKYEKDGTLSKDKPKVSPTIDKRNLSIKTLVYSNYRSTFIPKTKKN